MFASTIRDLRHERSWEPTNLTAQAFRWPSFREEARIQELAVRIYPSSAADAGAQVITPANLDSTTGAIRRRSRKYQGAVFQVGQELQSGDVVVPRTGLGPALQISDRLRGALVASRFTAIRPNDVALSSWIWAILNCDSGLQLRSHLATALGSAPSARNLMHATIPIPSTTELARITRAIDVIETSTHEEAEEEPAETWWSTADLRIREWRIALATPDPDRLESGRPLGEYCTRIDRGRNTRAGAIDYAAPGYLPVLDVSVLGGKPPRRWLPAESDNQIIAQPGNIAMAGLGNFAYATVIAGAAIVDQHTFLLQLKDESLGNAVAGFLNSREGYALRQIFLQGSTISSINNADVARIPIPHELLERFADTNAAPPVRLSRRLEQALWEI